MYVINKTTKYLLVGILTVCSNIVVAQCKCCSEAHRSFDFWVGDWNVYDTSGAKIGENTIAHIQDSCGLKESWSSKTMTGTSYNYYNTKDSLWHQVWIDNQGGSLVLYGNLKGESMVMRSDDFAAKNGDLIYNEIIWTPHADGSVTQRWNIRSSDGKILAEVFDGRYTRKE